MKNNYIAEIREIAEKQWLVFILRCGKIIKVKGMSYEGINSLMGARRVGVRVLHELGVVRPVVKVIRLKRNASV